MIMSCHEYRDAVVSKSVLLSSICLGLLLSDAAQAAILIDPGNVGDTVAAKVIPLNSTEIIGKVGGQNLSLDFIFSDMKYVDFTVPPFTSNAVAILQLTFDVPFPTTSDPIAGTQTGYLSDENGAPVPNTELVQSRAGDPSSPTLAGFVISAPTTPSSSPSTFRYYDLHFNITLPTLSSGDPATVVAASLELQPEAQLSPGVVGMSRGVIPEPSSGWLWTLLLALASGAGYCRTVAACHRTLSSRH
jgi:hypothetical protein